MLLLALLPAGCQFIRIEEGERTPLEYTIVKQEEIPEEISELMEQKKKKVFQMTYQVGDIRYLMKGYGEQLTGGYSIQVEEVSESENAVFCKTRLIGPEKADCPENQRNRETDRIFGFYHKVNRERKEAGWN